MSENKSGAEAGNLLKRLRKNLGIDEEKAEEKPQEPVIDKSEEERLKKLFEKKENKNGEISLEDFYGYQPVVKDRATARAEMKKLEAMKKKKTQETVHEEPPEEPEKVVDTDYNLMTILGMEPDSGEETPEVTEEPSYNAEVAEDERVNRDTDRKKRLYETSDEKKKIMLEYRSKIRWSFVSVILHILFLALAAVIEIAPSAGFDMPVFLDLDGFPSVVTWVEIQLLVLSAFLIRDSLLSALKTAFSGYPDASLLTLILYFFSFIYDILLLINNDRTFILFGMPVLLCGLFTAISYLLDGMRRLFGTKLTFSKSLKFAVNKLLSTEANEVSDSVSRFLPDDNKYLSIVQTKKISGLFEMNASLCKKGKNIRILIIVGVIEAVALAVYNTIRSGSVLTGFKTAFISFIMTLPFTVCILVSIPLFKLSLKGFRNQCAVIGNNTVTDCVSPATVILYESDLFKGSSVSIKGVKSYGDAPIDTLIRYTAEAYKPVGGPLSNVLLNVTESVDISDDVEILFSNEDGLEAAVEGKHVLLGNYRFMMMNRLTMPYDSETDSGSDVFMYIAVGDKVMGKFTLRYVPNGRFENYIGRLFDSGMTVVIKATDPNISLDLLCRVIGVTEHDPIKVIHVAAQDENFVVYKECRSPMFSVGDVTGLIRTLYTNNRANNVIGINTALAAISSVVGAVVMAVVLSLTTIASIPSAYVILYQLFWLVPSLILSLFAV
ncbi:MAG: hypothetical protein J5850_05815 [Clostridia bacterium]|nr:hypothetical protein [Clostridia bacterium]